MWDCWAGLEQELGTRSRHWLVDRARKLRSLEALPDYRRRLVSAETLEGEWVQDPPGFWRRSAEGKGSRGWRFGAPLPEELVLAVRLKLEPGAKDAGLFVAGCGVCKTLEA